MTAIQKLLEISSPALTEPGASQNRPTAGISERRTELNQLLLLKNGFFSFEGALHVFPQTPTHLSFGLDEWNATQLWRSCYQGMTDGCHFFAEDIFGGQFCIREEKISSFDPENGQLAHFADSLDSWAKAILDDYEVITGFPLAHQWQSTNGPLQPKHRLVPKIPFNLGGEYVLDNLFSLRADKGMQLRGELAVQLKNAPPGTRVEYKIIP